MSVNRIVRNAGVHERFSRRMLDDATHEAGHHGLVDLNDLERHVAVRRAVDILDCISIGCFRQAKRGLAFLVEPIGEESDTVPALDLEVPKMRECSFLGREADELMAVHVERHMMSMAQVSTSRQRRFAVGHSRDERPSTTSLAVVTSTGWSGTPNPRPAYQPG
jgi:hypothetical protein